MKGQKHVIAATSGPRVLNRGEDIQPSAIHIWEVLNGQEIKGESNSHPGHRVLAIAPDGRVLVSGGGDSSMLLWDLTGHACPAMGTVQARQVLEELAKGSAKPRSWKLPARR